VSERDELAKFLYIVDNRRAEDPGAEWDLCVKKRSQDVERTYRLADALIAEGYAKDPRRQAAREL
jgi:hypothetical protein